MDDEEVDQALEDGDDLVEEKTELETVAVALAEEVKGTSKALGSHMSSSNGSLKKLDSSSKNLQSTKGMTTTNQKNSNDLETGKFPLAKGLHAHVIRYHPGTASQLPIENPPEIVEDASSDSEDFIKNLSEKTVRGKRGRQGTKPHVVDSPESYLAKKKALLSGDFRELKNIIDHHDPTGYFRRAFGNFLDSPDKKKDIQMDQESLAATTLSSLRYDSSEKLIADSTSEDIYRTCMKTLALVGSKSTAEHGSEGSSSNIGKTRKTMDSDFSENQIIKKMATDDSSHKAQGTSDDEEDSPSSDLLP